MKNYRKLIELMRLLEVKFLSNLGLLLRRYRSLKLAQKLIFKSCLFPLLFCLFLRVSAPFVIAFPSTFYVVSTISLIKLIKKRRVSALSVIS